MLTIVNGSSIIQGYRSDHSIAVVSLKRTATKEKNRQYWKFNNSLLKDKSYIDVIKQLISSIKKQYAALVYNLDNVDFTINASDGNQRQDSIILIFKKKRDTAEEDQLINEIRKLESLDNLEVESMCILEEKKAQLEELRENKLN